MSNCCPEWHCISNLIDLPRRLTQCEIEELAEDSEFFKYPDFCVGCHSPNMTTNAFKFLVVDRVGQVEKFLAQKTVEWRKLESSTDMTLIYYSVGLRYQQRLCRWKQCRKNYVNTLILHPYHNAYRFSHQTFRYISPQIPIPLLVERLLNEAVGLLEEDIQWREPFHCNCIQDSDPVPANPEPDVAVVVDPSEEDLVVDVTYESDQEIIEFNDSEDELVIVSDPESEPESDMDWYTPSPTPILLYSKM